MNKWILILCLLLLACMNLQAEKTYNAEHYMVDMFLVNDGSILVSENVIFHFTGGPFRYVNRFVPGTKVDKLIFLDASMDSILITNNSVPNFYEMSTRNGLRMKWNYAPLKDETHSFAFKYFAYGAYTPENGMVHLRWKPLPSEFEYSMKKATIRVHLPSAIPSSRISFGPESTSQPQVIGDSLLVYEFIDLAPNTRVSIDLQFPENLIPVAQPTWIEHHRDNQRTGIYAAISFFIMFSVIITFSILAGIRRMSLYKRYTDPNMEYNEFPSSLEPALLSRLINGNYGISTALYATLVNLAQRGIVKILSFKKQKWYEAYGGLSFSYQLNHEEMTPTEQMIVDIVFGNPPTTNPVTLLQLQTIIRKNTRYMQNFIEDSLIRDGYIDSFQLEKRKKILTLGMLLTLVDFAAFFGALAYFKGISASILIPFVALFLSGILLLIYGGMKVIYTENAISEISYWNSFAKSLRKRMKLPIGEGNTDDFNRTFPYALVLNLGREWVNYFKKNGIDVGGVWLEDDGSSPDSWAPMILISSISSPSTGGSSGAGAGGGGGGGGSSSAG